MPAPLFVASRGTYHVRLKGKVALVTGGSCGIGSAVSRAFAREGAKVVITDIRVGEGNALARRLRADGVEALFLRQDVTQEQGWQEVCDQVVEHFGGLHILVNNAGIALTGSIETQTFADWRTTMAINLDAVFLGTRAGVLAMRDGGGSIINLSSIEGIVGNPHVPAYNASKGGVRLLTKSAAIHCARAGYRIRVNSVHPGYVGTALVQDALAHLPEDFADKTLERIPMQRFGEVEEIAATVVFLASDESSYMTGSELVVDGGLIA
ncbi:glucose 1-dehydrogenase [Novosphingobium sp. ERN07]|uniref:glucose 1-dehydrogenase n=1 Tax=Novosphingobium sp. ERN07 TaxID=2726187 RepID=UPI001456FF3D|nr:glucose 1-dehydrogenase [Novosphingobium sp. ERN07]NLR73052.1 glucose 1-dehydrogenase [Novosphingobium sp. ERN07]